MTTLRHRLHLWVAAWLIIQVAALSAFVPQDCCAAHKAQHQKSQQTTVKSSHDHHQMNHEMVHHEAAAPTTPIDQCVMQGTCKGPMSAIVALLSNHGVPPVASFAMAPESRVTSIVRAVSEHVCSRLASPDPPPPRA